MTIDAQQEKEFYDHAYATHLAAEEGALACNREILERQFDTPTDPMYERRKLYKGVLDALLKNLPHCRNVLDYGCGTGEWGVMMACEGASVSLLDLSPVGVEIGLRRAKASGVADRVRGFAQDAGDLNCFADGEFDLIYASAALHHTMKYSNALSELLRVLKPAGLLVLAEGYGNNLLLNKARRIRAAISHEPVEAGEGIIFSTRDVEILRSHMAHVEITPLNLFAMAKRLFRGRFDSRGVQATMFFLETIDTVILRAAPFLKRYCGELIVVATK
ncbi:MAG: hypothetical protein CMN58_06870 [Solibacterales bacterium]|mgnify:CR=1 FL=1|nr:hypothetical protein [Bryobacterales bacterium]